MTYTFPEIGINHNGDIELFKELILKSKKVSDAQLNFKKEI